MLININYVESKQQEYGIQFKYSIQCKNLNSI
jgi:hypothetical protein